jgi:hypothetical protein
VAVVDEVIVVDEVHQVVEDMLVVVDIEDRVDGVTVMVIHMDTELLDMVIHILYMHQIQNI